MKTSALALLVFLLHTTGFTIMTPGDFVVIQVEGNSGPPGSRITLLTLTEIADGELLRITDRVLANGSFDGSGGTEVIPLQDPSSPGSPIPPATVIELDLPSIYLEYGEALHFYHDYTDYPSDLPPGPGYVPYRHLYLLEANQDGLRWYPTPPGLHADLTHIVAPGQGIGSQIDLILREALTEQAFSPVYWARVLSFPEAWEDPGDWDSSPSLLPYLVFEVNDSGGLVTFPYENFIVREDAGTVYVPVRRQFSTEGSATVGASLKTSIEPLQDFNPGWIDGFYDDLTGIAYCPDNAYTSKRFVALGPQSGVLFHNHGSGWFPADTNGVNGLNFKLADIVCDGEWFIACSLDGNIFTSHDGINFIQVYSGTKGTPLYRVNFLPSLPTPYVACGRDGGILAADDPNGPWFPVNVPVAALEEKIFDVATDGSRYFAVGSNGLMLETVDLNDGFNVVQTFTTQNLYAATSRFGSTYPGVYVVGADGFMGRILAGATGSPLSLNHLDSDTGINLIDVRELQAMAPSGAVESYMVAVGAQGTITVAQEDASFQKKRTVTRSEGILSLATDALSHAGESMVAWASGEYGTVVELRLNETPLSGASSNLALAGPGGGSPHLTWANAENGDKYLELTPGGFDSLAAQMRLCLERPASNFDEYQFGQESITLNLFASQGSFPPPMRDNFGTSLRLVDVGLTIDSNGSWLLAFRVDNRSQKASGELFVRFEGTNRPDYYLGNQLPGGIVAASSTSSVVIIPLNRPIELISLMEENAAGEKRTSFRYSINSLRLHPNWSPNGIFPRSFATYLDELYGPLPVFSSGLETGKSPYGKSAEPISIQSSFGGSVPPRPSDVPDDSAYLLFSVEAVGPEEMEVREAFDFYATGEFFHSGSGTVDDYALSEVEWALAEGGGDPEGLSLVTEPVSPDGIAEFEAVALPNVAYPRTLTFSATSSEGAPVDGEGVPISYNDDLVVTIERASGDVDFSAYISTFSSLSGDDALATADPDGDGDDNFKEFAFAKLADTADAFDLTSHTVDAASGTMTFFFTIPADRDGVRFRAETTTDLSATPIVWTEQSLTFVSANEVEGTETWSISAVMGTDGWARLNWLPY